MTRRVLLIAFHFPPIKISSGLERTLALTRHLPRHGWEPLVLSASPKAYPAVSDERLGQIPAGTIVERPFARDASKTLSIAGRYPSWVTLPDRWASWTLGAIPRGLQMIRQYQPDLIWSTYPIASAHVIGCALHRLTGVPWVADFRDPMVEYDDRKQTWSPPWTALRRWRLWIEGLAARHATGITTCTEGSQRILAERYPESARQHWRIVSNGYDETAFAAAAHQAPPARPSNELLLLHSGTIYPSADRDPSFFLRALRRVIDQRPVGARKLKVLLRASSVESLYQSLVAELRLQDHVAFGPAIPYEAALAEMMHADGVLVFQGYTSNPAIPAKLYEYFRAQRPILALADSEGDTARLIQRLNAGVIAPLDDVDKIAVSMLHYLEQIESGRSQVVSPEACAPFERANTVGQFAALFDDILRPI